MKKALSRKAALTKGALLASLRLAADAKLDLNGVLSDLTQENFNQQKPRILKAIEPSLAKDASIEDVAKLLDTLENVDQDVDVEAAPAHVDIVPTDDEEDDMPAAIDANPAEELMALLQGKLDEETMAQVAALVQSMAPAATDELDDEPGDDVPLDDELGKDNPPPTPGTPPAPSDDKDSDVVSRTAMDSAIQRATKEAEQRTVRRLQDVRAAEEAVRPYVGRLPMSYDSAAAVYKAALDSLGVAVEGVHPSAYRAILEAQPRPGATRMARDSASPDAELATRFPGLASIRQI